MPVRLYDQWHQGAVGPALNRVAVLALRSVTYKRLGSNADLQKQYRRWRGSLPVEIRNMLSDSFEEEGELPDRALLADGQSLITVEEVLDVLRRQVPLVVVPEDTHFRPDAGPVGEVTAAWRHVVFRQARAFLTLWDVGLSHEAQPNARCVVEHGILLQHLGTAAAAGASMEYLQAVIAAGEVRGKQQLTVLRAMDDRSGGQFADPLSAMETHRESVEQSRKQKHRPPPGVPLPDVSKMTSLLRASPDGPHFEAIWKDLSEGSHAGMGSIWPYLRRALRTGNVSEDPEPIRWTETAVALTWCLWIADDTLDRFLLDTDLAGRHLPLMGEVGLAPR